MGIAAFLCEQQSEEHGGHTGNRNAPLILRSTKSVRGAGRSETQNEEERRPDVLPVSFPGTPLQPDRNRDDQSRKQHEVTGKPLGIHMDQTALAKI